MSFLRWVLVACLLNGAPSLQAAEPIFAVQIVPKVEAQPSGLPMIGLPLDETVPSEFSSEDKIEGGGFYVTVRNVSKKTVVLDLAASEWYECLTFVLSSHKDHHWDVHRPPGPWAANPHVKWTFPPDGMKIFVVNFASGRWTGATGDYPPIARDAQFHLKAFFHYRERAKDETKTSESAEIAAINQVF